jgi:prefoldin subunit 5
MVSDFCNSKKKGAAMTGFDPNEVANAGAASYAQGRARSAQEAVRHLENRVEQLNFICQAMWQLLQEQTNLDEQTLIQRVQYLEDQYDENQVEQANTNQRRSKCPQCERTMSPRHDTCLYCGAGRPIDSAFDLL